MTNFIDEGTSWQGCPASSNTHPIAAMHSKSQRNGASVLLAIGETMAMVTPVRAEPVEFADDFLLDAGGAESNVAIHVAALGQKARWFSKVGDDELGRRILKRIGRTGVDVTEVILDKGHPTGLYLKSPGRGVTYYRSGSAASTLAECDVSLAPLSDVRILHVSGITAAISATAARFLSSIIERARREGILVSFDVNHRAKLWELEVAAPVLEELAYMSDIVFVGRDEAESLWGTKTPLDIRGRLAGVAELIVKDGDVGATAFCGVDAYFEPALGVEVVEAVGAGDAFAGGYLAALLAGESVQNRLRAGHTRAALTLATTADFVDEKETE